MSLASLKSLGDKTASLFERKKKDAEQLAADKLAEAQKNAEEQAKRAGDAFEQTKKEAGDILSSTGSFARVIR